MHSDKGREYHPDRIGRTTLVGCALMVLCIACAWLGYAQVSPQRPGSSDVQVEAAYQRAQTHLQAVASVPHPMGSPENIRVRDYLTNALIEMGYTPKIESYELGVEPSPENIVAVLDPPSGFEPLSHGTVLAMAHYDSVADAPGAGDNGAALSAYLEAARALMEAPPEGRANRVILLITDGEEAGLQGASAYVGAHPEIVDQVGFVINFDARGNAGAPLMFQTGNNGAGPVAVLRRMPKPMAFSFAADLYAAMPNDTDFTPMLEAGRRGLNFAAIGGARHYHQPTDDIAHLSQDTLYSFVALMLPLFQTIAGTDLAALGTGESAYFPLLPGNLVSVPIWLSTVLAWGTLALAIGFCVLAVWRGWARTGRLCMSVPVGLGVVALATGLAYGIARGAQALFSTHTLLGGTGTAVMLVAVALGGWLIYGLTAALLKGTHPTELCGALAVLCALGAGVLTVVMPGTAYLMIGMAWMMLLCALANALPVVRFILVPGAALLTTVVMALLVTPAVYLGHLAMGVEALHLCMAVAALAMLGVFAGWGMLICKVKPIQKKIHDERGSARYEA